MALSNLLRRNKDTEKKNTQFEEIEEYRDLLDDPDEFVDGFNMKTIVGALFVSIVMVPGNIYLDLMIGGSIGAAAQWVTIILFIELAKRLVHNPQAAGSLFAVLRDEFAGQSGIQCV